MTTFRRLEGEERSRQIEAIRRMTSVRRREEAEAPMPVVAWEDPPPHRTLLRYVARNRKKLIERIAILSSLGMVWWLLAKGYYGALADGLVGILAGVIVDQGWEKRRWTVVVLGYALLIGALLFGIVGHGRWAETSLVSALIGLITSTAGILKRLLFPKAESDAKWDQPEKLRGNY